VSVARAGACRGRVGLGGSALIRSRASERAPPGGRRRTSRALLICDFRRKFGRLPTAGIEWHWWPGPQTCTGDAFALHRRPALTERADGPLRHPRRGGSFGLSLGTVTMRCFRCRNLPALAGILLVDSGGRVTAKRGRRPAAPGVPSVQDVAEMIRVIMPASTAPSTSMRAARPFWALGRGNYARGAAAAVRAGCSAGSGAHAVRRALLALIEDAADDALACVAGARGLARCCHGFSRPEGGDGVHGVR